MTEFAKNVKIELVKRSQSQKWLIEEVAKKTGMYFDDSYLSKIFNGKNNNQRFVDAIKEILEI